MASASVPSQQPCVHRVRWVRVGRCSASVPARGCAGRPGCCAMRRAGAREQGSRLGPSLRASVPEHAAPRAGFGGKQQCPARVPVRPCVHRHLRRLCCGPGRHARVKAMPTLLARSVLALPCAPLRFTAFLFASLRPGLRSACGLRGVPLRAVPSLRRHSPGDELRTYGGSNTGAAACPPNPFCRRARNLGTPVSKERCNDP